MPPIDFYYIKFSPFCRTVEMVANLAGVTLNKHVVDLMARDHLKDDYLKLNPLHKVPFIVDGDLKINESRAISTYLVTKYMPNDDSLYPKDPVKRARVDELLYIDCGTLHPAALRLLRRKLFGKVDKLDPVDEHSYLEIVGYFDDRIKNCGSKFILGDQLTLADISLSATFTFPDSCGYSLSKFTHLTAYLDRLASSIPKYKEINEEAVAGLKKHIESKQV